MKLTTISTVLFAASMSANASLLGDTIAMIDSPVGNATATIGPGIEFPMPSIVLSFDFDSDTVTIRNLWGNPLISNYSGPFGYGIFNITGFDTEIVGLSLISNIGWRAPFVSPGGYSYTANSLQFDATGFDATGFTNNHVDIGAEAIFRITTVPEPGSVQLLASGLIGLLGYGWWRSRRCAEN